MKKLFIIVLLLMPLVIFAQPKKVRVYDKQNSSHRAALRTCNDMTPKCITYKAVEDARGRMIIPEHVVKNFSKRGVNFTMMQEVDFERKPDPLDDEDEQ